MTKLESFFNNTNTNKKFLVSFIMAGYPTIEDTISHLHALADNGSDVIEIGVPFSDPFADGEVIKEAALHTIEKYNTNLDDIFTIIAKFREINKTTPLVLMGYYNNFYQYNITKLAENMQKHSVSGLLIVDTPLEEYRDMKNICTKYDVDFISLIAPTTPLDRIENIAKQANGFIYYISVTGTTGSKMGEIDKIKQQVEKIKQFSNCKVMVGFGISGTDDIKNLIQFVDGVVIGSAYIKKIKQHINNPNQATEEIKKLSSYFAKALL